MYCRNSTCDANFKLKPCTCAQSHALGTRTKFQLEILTVNVISGVVYFHEIISESSRYVSETTPRSQVSHGRLYIIFPSKNFALACSMVSSWSNVSPVVLGRQIYNIQIKNLKTNVTWSSFCLANPSSPEFLNNLNPLCIIPWGNMIYMILRCGLRGITYVHVL